MIFCDAPNSCISMTSYSFIDFIILCLASGGVYFIVVSIFCATGCFWYFLYRFLEYRVAR